MNSIDSAEVELNQLVSLFYSPTQARSLLGEFVEVSSAELPLDYRRLLAHDHHMTIAVESHHGSPVSLQVLAARQEGDSYSRKIALNRISDGQAVLFGIVRIDLSVLNPQVRQAIESMQKPLGQVLIEHDVLRQVKLGSLFCIKPGEDLGKLFGRPSVAQAESEWPTPHRLASPIFGRTALIFCDGRPVIELLEIVVI